MSGAYRRTMFKGGIGDAIIEKGAQLSDKAMRAAGVIDYPVEPFKRKHRRGSRARDLGDAVTGSSLKGKFD